MANEGSQPGILSRVTDFLGATQTWVGTALILWAGMSWAVSTVSRFGEITTGEAVIIGALLMVVIMLGFTGSLALWRVFSPLAGWTERKTTHISAARGTIISFRGLPPVMKVPFREYLQGQGAYMGLRPYFRPQFLKEMRTWDGSDEDLMELYLQQVDRVAKRWGVF